MSTFSGPKNIQIMRGLSSDRNLLSCNVEGTKVDLYFHPEGGRQEWLINPHPNLPKTDLIFSIQSNGTVNDGRKWLSTNGNTSTSLSLFADPQDSSYWKIQPAPDCPLPATFIIQPWKNPTHFLSVKHDGTLVDIYNQNEMVGRQWWTIYDAYSKEDPQKWWNH